jgi:molybdopterin-guanine dinucleotide biosynthesis protein A
VGAVILAGGAATRVGGRDKPALAVRGVPMLDRVLAAVAGARQRIVVGPPRSDLPVDVRCVREQPPGGGPVAATAAGLALVDADLVALLAADLPFLTGEAVLALVAALDEPATPARAPDARAPDEPVPAVDARAADVRPPGAYDGAMYVDDTGRRQLLCGVWRTGSLRAALESLGASEGRSMRALLGGLRVAEVRAPAGDRPPWFDCDTDNDLYRANQGDP